MKRPSPDSPENDLRSIVLPKALQTITLEALEPIARLLASAGVSANAVTASSLVVGAAGGACLALGHFGVAAIAVLLASLGDTLDGLVARRTRTVSPAGALFDASVDRYEEFFVLGGLAFFFRASGAVFALALFALVGSFMVSYGTAKAEALRVPIPKGIMRRAERAVSLGAGIAAVPLMEAAVRRYALPAWLEWAPIIVSMAIVAVVANASAVVRLRAIASAAAPSPPMRLPLRLVRRREERPADAAE